MLDLVLLAVRSLTPPPAAAPPTRRAVSYTHLFWGFGLEGVGKSNDDTVTPEQLLGDAFNFLARNIRPQGVLSKDATGRPTLSVSLGNTAAPLRFVKAEVDWLGGFPQTYTFDPPREVQDISLEPDPAVDPADLAALIPVVLYPCLLYTSRCV